MLESRRHRVGLSWCLFLIVAYANVVQHCYLPDAVANAWYNEVGYDMGAHELKLRSSAGYWVYLTAQILFMLAAFLGASAGAETLVLFSPKAGARTAAVIYSTTPLCLGLALVCYVLFVFFYVLMMTLNPTWRDQWSYYEALGYPYERWMHMMHTPIWLCPLADLVFVKDAAILRKAMPAAQTLAAATVGYIGFYAAVSHVNYAHTRCYCYPWLHDIQESAGAPGFAAYYAGVCVPVLAVVFGCCAACRNRPDSQKATKKRR